MNKIKVKNIAFLLMVCLGMIISCESTKTATGGNNVPDKVQNTETSQSTTYPTEAKIQESYTEKIPSSEISLEMLLIPKGSFTMGSPDSETERKLDEGSQKEVEIDAFYMGKYEVTWDLFELFFPQNKELFVKLEDDKIVNIDAISGPTSPYEDPSNGMGKKGFPAVSMSTYSALVFCKWLSTLTGKFYRLPTEAEWEYAARAGTQSIYSFGNSADDINDYAVYYENSNNAYAKVGSKKPNPWGLYDMHGNVAEWTLDGYKEGTYATMDTKNPWQVPMLIHPRVFRGGSWDDDPNKLRSAARSASSLKLQKRDPQIPKSFWWFTDSNYVGFRLVSPKKQPSAEDQKKFWQMVLDE